MERAPLAPLAPEPHTSQSAFVPWLRGGHRCARGARPYVVLVQGPNERRGKPLHFSLSGKMDNIMLLSRYITGMEIFMFHMLNKQRNISGYTAEVPPFVPWDVEVRMLVT